MSEADERPAAPDRQSDFLRGEAGRPLRILSEYLEPLARFQAEGICDTVVFFGSARLGADGPLGRYYEDARTLARELTTWARANASAGRFVVCSGGGGGIMEAANRGAREAGGRTIGLNIGLPHEQRPNAYITPELGLEFHYFFMRKLWFAHLARALVAFPGGFGTLDEVLELLLLAQTGKLARKPVIVLYGSEFWRKVINFELLAEHALIAREDLSLFHYVDDVGSALSLLQALLPVQEEGEGVAFAASQSSGSTIAR